MGIFLTKLYGLFENFSSTPSARVLMLGLDAAGKTTILYKIKLNETVSTIPTIGFNVETVTPVKGVSFTVWDVGGQEKIRRLWQHYFQNAQGLVFVVDSSDKERLIEAKEELFRIMNSDELRQVPVEIIANKQDLPGSLKPFEIAEKLELAKLSGHQWHIQGACAAKGDGLFEAMESLSSMIKTFQKQQRYV